MSAKTASAPSAATESPSKTTHDVDKTCVVCFKIVDIFSIGECDHPVCYECSTRMRVLCKQNECPICRRINQKVIFTSEILPYRELDQKNRSGLYDKTFRICFSGQRTQNAFQRLLEHRCCKCTKGPFETGVALKDHLRKEHELFYCDICTEHLKIFSFERRAYTREQLAQHRRKGDPDNKSHRGHPLCEYCDQRYLDRDELFRHLRKEHYFCHFCDADGSNHFYADHTSLREHFIDQHYLCEEGDCKENIFTAAFRSDIDLKAHKANVHGQTSKQARTIDLQFNLAPRIRPTSCRPEEPSHDDGHNGRSESNATTSNASARRVIDAQNEQEFPSLGNAPVTIRQTVALNTRQFGTSGLARTKENFPALGGVDTTPRTMPAQTMPQASAILFKTPAPAKPSAASKASNNAKQKVNHTKSVNDFPALPVGNPSAFSNASAYSSSAASASTNGKATNAKQKVNTVKSARDFPTLFGSASVASSRSANNNYRDLESDLIENAPAYDISTVSSKHRALVQSYESVSSSGQVNQKIKTVQRVETKSQPSSSDFVPLINSKKSFPALGGGGGGGASTTASAPQWLNATTTKAKKDPVQSKKSKVAPAPLLPTSKSAKSNSENNTNAASETPKKTGKAKAAKEAGGDGETASKTDAKQKANVKSTKKTSEESNPNKENHGDKAKTSNQKSKKANAINGTGSNHLLNGNENAAAVSSPLNETINSYSSVALFTAPPPGFPAKSKATHVRAPPGFESLHTESQASTFAYISPSNALQRNQMLISHFTKSLNASAVDEFRTVSRLFREGCCNARAYYEHCEVVLGERFENIFPELLVLLPDISKQQELLEVYMQKHDETETRLINYIQVCELCQQVLKRSDFTEHWKFHQEIEKDNKLNKNFPKLSSAAKK